MKLLKILQGRVMHRPPSASVSIRYRTGGKPTSTKDETPHFSPNSLSFSVPKAIGCLSVLYQIQNAYFWVTEVKWLCKFTWCSPRNNITSSKLIAADSF